MHLQLLRSNTAAATESAVVPANLQLVGCLSCLVQQLVAPLMQYYLHFDICVQDLQL